MSYPHLQPIPADTRCNYVRETPAPAGWVAYYVSRPDEDEQTVYAHPVVLWVAVQYGADSEAVEAASSVLDAVLDVGDEVRNQWHDADTVDTVVQILKRVEVAAQRALDTVDAHADDLAQEIRPMVCTRTGAIVDALDVPHEFLCILGPGMRHRDFVQGMIRARRPDLAISDDDQDLASSGDSN